MIGKEQSIIDYLNTHGLLLCNENRSLPSLSDVGGDWDSIVSLIEKRKAFYCKVYKKRTCYLSKEFYFLIKGYKHSNLNIPALSMDIYNFLRDNGPADTETIRDIFRLSRDGFNAAFDILLERMLATAVKRGKTLGKTWSTFIWGTYMDWEEGVVPVVTGKEDYDRLFRILGLNLSEKEIQKIIS